MAGEGTWGRLGNATAKGACSVAGERDAHIGHGFDVLGDFAHSFCKPCNVTFDFTGMTVHIARGAESTEDAGRGADSCLGLSVV